MRFYMIGGGLIFIGLALLLCVYVVPDGYAALIYSFGKYQRTEEAGLHFKKPWETKKLLMIARRAIDYKPKKVTILAGEGEEKGEMGLIGDWVILISIDPRDDGPRKVDLYNKTGETRDPDHSDDNLEENFDLNSAVLSPMEKLIGDKARSIFSSIVAKMQYTEIVEKKEEISDDVRDKLNKFMSQHGVIVEDFIIKEVEMIADEDLKKANKEEYIARRNAAAENIKAETEKTVMLIRADAKKQAAFLEAEGEQRRGEVRIKILEAAQNAGVSEQYLRDETLATYREMGKSGNSKIVMFPGGGSFSDMGRLASVVASAVSAAREATSEDTAEKEETAETEE